MRLSVAILTYNQERFIREALDSVLMQEVEFDYEVVVGDDCSTDATPAILREYAEHNPGKFHLILNTENVGISKNYQNVLYACKGEYVALLEGDDYWTDKAKLQKSVDFLDYHPDYGFVGAYNILLYPDGRMEKDPYDYFSKPDMEGNWELYGKVFDYAKNGPVTRTLTICFRKSIIEPYMQYTGLGNDMVLQSVLAHESKFAKCREEWAVYRQGGISSSERNMEKTFYYTQWVIDNRMLQKKFFPKECDFDEDELFDRLTYVKLRDAVFSGKIAEALRYHALIKSEEYKRKKYYKFTRNAMLCAMLYIVFKFRPYCS